MNYTSAPFFIETLKALCKTVKIQDNADEELDLQTRGRREEPPLGDAHMAGGSKDPVNE